MSSPSLKSATTALVGLVCCVLLASQPLGCRQAPQPEPPRTTHSARPFVPAPPLPPDAERRRLLADPELREIDDLLARAVEDTRRFAEASPSGNATYAQIEVFYASLGRLAELLDIYRERIDGDGPDSAYAPRLAVFYTLLGYRDGARQLIDAARAAGATQPELDFAAGFWEIEQPEPGPAAQQRAARHFIATLAATEPRFAAVHQYDRAWVEARLGQYSAAERAGLMGDPGPLARQRVGDALKAGADQLPTGTLGDLDER